MRLITLLRQFKRLGRPLPEDLSHDLQEQIDSYEPTTRFLSSWNCLLDPNTDLEELSRVVEKDRRWNFITDEEYLDLLNEIKIRNACFTERR